MWAPRADGANGATGYQLRSTKTFTVAGFRFRESGNGVKEVKESEACTYGFCGSPRCSSDDGGYGCSGIRQDYGGKGERWRQDTEREGERRSDLQREPRRQTSGGAEPVVRIIVLTNWMESWGLTAPALFVPSVSENFSSRQYE